MRRKYITVKNKITKRVKKMRRKNKKIYTYKN